MIQAGLWLEVAWMSVRLACALLLTLSAHAHAQEPEAEQTRVGYTIEPAAVSAYVWRGDRLSGEGFDPAVQPFGELNVSRLGAGNLTTGVWSSRRLGREHGQEIDPYVSFAVDVGPVQLKPGYTVYFMPALEPFDTMHEFSLQSIAVWSFPVRPYVTAAVDPIRTRGFYACAGAVHTLSLAPVQVVTTFNVGTSQYSGLAYALQDVTLSTRGQLAFGASGYYAALVAAGAWSGRASLVYPYTGMSLGYSR